MARAADAPVRFLKIGKANDSNVRRVCGQLIRRPLGSQAEMTLTEARSAAVAVDTELRSGNVQAGGNRDQHRVLKQGGPERGAQHGETRKMNLAP